MDKNAKFRSSLITRGVSSDKSGMDLSELLGEDGNLHSGLLLEAERLIELIRLGNLSVGRLVERQKNLLALYFFATTAIVNRIVDIHTTIPLSSMNIQKPKSVSNDILQDYVYNFFETMLKKNEWKKVAKIAIIHYWLFSEAVVLLEEEPSELDIEYNDSFLDDITKAKQLTEEEEEKIKNILDKYNQGGEEEVSYEEIEYVLNKSFFKMNKNYSGIKSMRVISPFSVLESRVNDEVNLIEIVIDKSEHILQYLLNNPDKSEEEIIADLQSVGYNTPYIEKNINKNNSKLEIDNDIYSNDGVYISLLSGNSICGIKVGMIFPILKDLINYWLSLNKINEKLKLMNQKINFVTTNEDVSEDQLVELEGKIETAINGEEGSVITTNFDVNVSTVDLNIADQIDVDSISESSQSNILSGSGTPEGLLNAEDSYGGSYLKLEVLNNEFVIFRQNIAEFWEEKIFKPVAIKKGFIYLNKFGNKVPVYPSVNFRVGSIIGTSDFQSLLQDLADDEKISLSTFLEYIGFDSEQVMQERIKEKKLMESVGLDD